MSVVLETLAETLTMPSRLLGSSRSIYEQWTEVTVSRITVSGVTVSRVTVSQGTASRVMVSQGPVISTMRMIRTPSTNSSTAPITDQRLEARQRFTTVVARARCD